jgi:hypothetical protein
MFERLKSWWLGQYVRDTLEHVLDANSPGAGHFDRPWLARAVRAVSAFCTREWKWLIPVLLSGIGGTVAIVKLFL